MSKPPIINGPMEGRCFELDGDTTFVGRSFDNDIQINEQSVSIKHAKTIRKGNKKRRVTSPEKLELLCEVYTILMQSLEIDEICEKIMDSLFYCLKRIDSGAILLPRH